MTRTLTISDFYDRDWTATVTTLDDPGVAFRLTVDADPGAPGQSIDLSARSARRLVVFLQEQLP
jgi:hypothetical protein